MSTKIEPRINEHVNNLIKRHPILEACREDIISTYLLIKDAYEKDHKLLIAGNGGSAADAEHIAGELMKRFNMARPVDADFAAKLKEIDPIIGGELSKNLEKSLMAIPLVAHEALTTAYINDVDALGVFAQQLFGYGREVRFSWGTVAKLFKDNNNKCEWEDYDSEEEIENIETKKYCKNIELNKNQNILNYNIDPINERTKHFLEKEQERGFYDKNNINFNIL